MVTVNSFVSGREVRHSNSGAMTLSRGTGPFLRCLRVGLKLGAYPISREGPYCPALWICSVGLSQEGRVKAQFLLAAVRLASPLAFPRVVHLCSIWHSTPTLGLERCGSGGVDQIHPFWQGRSRPAQEQSQLAYPPAEHPKVHPP